jgi:hypothetical protein
MYGVFPGNAITSEPSALRSMILRGVFNDSTGFSLAWKSNLWARFHLGVNRITIH